MSEWIPVFAAWIGAIAAGVFSLVQWSRSVNREAQKELNAERLKFYPEVQSFMSACYEVGWQEAMKDSGRLGVLISLSNRFVLWASDDTLKAWAVIVDEGQRGKLKEVGHLALRWVELNLRMREDLGYGSALRAEDIFPIFFSPKTVDRIRGELANGRLESRIKTLPEG